MTWWKEVLWKILDRFPSEKPDYQDLQAWAREKEVHPIYAIELTCYKHDRPIALEQRSIGVWHCPICSKPKPSVWIDEITQEQIHAYIPVEEQADPFAEIHQQLQERRVLMRHNTSALARKIQLIGDDPDKTEYEVPAFLKDRAV